MCRYKIGGTPKFHSYMDGQPETGSYFTCLFSTVVVLLSISSGLAHAGPDEGNVVGGLGSISHNGNTTTINQSTDLMAIDWRSYDVAADERVNYIQPDTSSISLNRILSNHGSQILGQIDANGQVLLVNPNGIVFGENATVNVGGILASGLNINPDDFMNGNFTFAAMESAEGKVINSGLINAATGGAVTLLGTQVENKGLIVANLGAVNLAAGKEAILTFDSSGLMGVRITKEILQEELGVNPSVINTGEITAESGRILLSGSVSEDIFSQAVNVGSQARSAVVHEDGSFTLGSGADVLNTGMINASSGLSDVGAGKIVLVGENVESSGEIRADGVEGSIELHSVNTTQLLDDSTTSAAARHSGKGGDVKILGERIGIFGNSNIDVSAFTDAGKIFIGGDYKGGNRGIRNAEFTIVDDGVIIQADSLVSGGGGKIISWANQASWFLGNISARGGLYAGDGGFVEVSAESLFFEGKIDVGSASGKSGTILFDPTNITIVDGNDGNSGNESTLPDLSNATAGSGDFIIDENSLEALAENSSIVLEATNNITMQTLFRLDLELNNSGSITMAADSDNNGVGYFSMDTADIIETLGGDVTISGAQVTVGIVETGSEDNQDGGNITLTATNGHIYTGDLSAAGGNRNTTTRGLTGRNGGVITLTASNGGVYVDGDIDTRGGITLAYAGHGGEGGNVSISSTGCTTACIDSSGDLVTVSVSGNIDTIGGYGKGDDTNDLGRGGNAGDVIIDFDGIYYAGTVDARGGNGVGRREVNGIVTRGNGGIGGAINIDGDQVIVSGDLMVSGGNGGLNNGDDEDEAGNGGAAGTIDINGTSVVIGGLLEANGGNSGFLGEVSNDTGNGGNGGLITVTTHTLSLNSDFEIGGGAIPSGADHNSSEGADGIFEVFLAGNDARANINYDSPFSYGFSISDLTVDEMGQVINGTNQTLRAPDRPSNTNSWQVTSRDGGTLNNTISFYSIENLTGNAGADSFVIGVDGSISGTIDGGGSDDGDTLTAQNSANAWDLNTGNQGQLSHADPVVVYVNNFTNIENIVGGSDSDTFNVNSSGLAFNINGGGSVFDTLIGPVNNNIWILGEDGDSTESTLDGISFLGIYNVTGSGQTDTFTVNNVNSVLGIIDGAGGDDDELTITSEAGIATVAIGPDTAGIGAVNVYNIENINAVEGSTLTADSTDNVWRATDFDVGAIADGVDDGQLQYDVTFNGDGSVASTTTTISFTGFANLSGAAGDDIFIIDDAARLTGTIDGNRTITSGDINTLQSNSASGTNNWNATSITAGDLVYNSNSTGYSDIQSFVGSASVADTFNGFDGETTWTIAPSGNSYALTNSPGTTATFSNMDTLQGGSVEDVFSVSATFTGNIRGGNGGDIFDVGASVLSGTIYGEGGADSFTISNNNVAASIEGGGGTDEIVGWTDPSPEEVDTDTDDNRWEITGSDSGTLRNQTSSGDVVTFSSMETITGGDDEKDVVDFATTYLSGFDGTIRGGSGDDIFNLDVNRYVTGGVAGGDGDDTFTFSGGSFSGAVAGENGSDVFRVNAGSVSSTVVVTGGDDGGTDWVIGPSGDIYNNYWRLDTASSGVLAPESDAGQAFQFSGIEDLTGGDGVDTFDFRFAGTFGGTVNAGAANDIVDLSNVSANATATLGQDINSVLNAEVIKGNGTGTLLINPSAAVDPGSSLALVTWTVSDIDGDGDATAGFSDAINDGLVQDNSGASLRFLDFNNLTGSSINDHFVIESGATITGMVDGRGATNGTDQNTLQSNSASGVNIWALSTLFSGSLTHGASSLVTNFQDIHTITGSSAVTDTMNGTNVNSRWVINSTNAGSYALESAAGVTLAFSEVDALQGGSQVDRFDIQKNIGNVNGGAGADRFEINGDLITAILNGGEEAPTDTNSDRLVALQDSANFWQFVGAESGTVNNGPSAVDPKVTFSEMEILEGAHDYADIFQFFDINSIAMSVIAGDSSGDELTFGFSGDAQAVNVSVAADAASTMGIQGLESITGTGVEGSTITAINSGTSTWLFDSLNSGSLTVGSQETEFSGFTHLVGGAGSDEFTIEGSPTSVDGGSGDDTFTVTGTLTTLIGGGGRNTLTGRGAPNEFALGENDVNAGRLLDITDSTAPVTYISSFSGVQVFRGGASLADRLNASQLDTDIIIDLGGSPGTIEISGFEIIDANISSGRQNTLIGGAGGNIWEIDSDYAGSIGDIEFSGFRNLQAGSGGDDFNIGGLIEQITGGNGEDTFALNHLPLTANLVGGGGTDAITGFSADSTWNVSALSSDSSVTGGTGFVTFSLIENLIGRDNAADTFVFDAVGSIANISITAGEGADLLGNEIVDTVDYSLVSSSDPIDVDPGGAFSGVAEAERIKGNSGLTLMASGGGSWNIYDFDGAGSDANIVNDGVVNGVQFIDFGNLQGGSGADTFVFGGGSIEGNIIGAGNNDTISRTTSGTTWIISGADEGSFDDLGGTFSGISTLQGNAEADTFTFQTGSSWSGTIIGGDGAGEDVVESRHSVPNTWEITGNGSGSVTWLHSGNDNGFTGIETIEGSDSSDTFNLRAGGSIGRITGGSGVEDFIVALNDVANRWNITGDDAGNITNSDGLSIFVAEFTGIENLTGNDADDYFDVSFEANITGTIDGGETDNDTLDLRDYGPAIVNLDGEDVEGFNTQNIEAFLVDGTQDNELSGGNIARDWYIIGEDSITINGRTYTGFSSLTGGNLNDNFIFQVDGSLTGTISGGEGFGTDSITGPNEASTWRISSNETGSIDSILPSGFSQVEQIQGGNGQDIFHIDGNVSQIMAGDGLDTFHVNSEFSGALNGEAGADIFNLAAAVNSEVIGGLGADTFNVSFYDDGLTLTGSADSDDDTLNLAHSQAAIWTLDGDGEQVMVGSASVTFSGIQIINGSMGADTFDVTGEFAGAVNGREGGDTFNLQASVVEGASGGAGDNIFNILSESVLTILTGGDDTDTLAIGHGGDVLWNIGTTSSTITNQDDSPGQITFSGIESGEGSAGNDVFNLSASFNNLDGNTGFDEFNINASSVTATLTGSSDFTVLNVSHDSESTWTLDGADEQVNTDNGVVTFSGMGQLNGGTGRDIFNVTGSFNSASAVNGRQGDDIFSLFASVGGSLNGGDGSDSFVIDNGSFRYFIDGGDNNDTLTINYAGDSTWTIDGDSELVIASGAAEATQFTSVEVLQGGDGVDHVNIHTSFNGTIDGRGNSDNYTVFNPGVITAINDSGASGSDVLAVNHEDDTTWVLSGANSTLTDVSGNILFSGIEVANGGAGDDSFTVSNAMERITGGDGLDEFYIGANVTNGVFGGGDDDTFAVTAEDLTLSINGNDDNDTLIGAGSNNLWRITDANRGTLANGTVINFEEVENLTGGIGDDEFTFVVADGRTGSLNGIIDGGAHAIDGDSIDAVQLGGGLTITVGDDSSDINFIGIEEIQVAESNDPNEYNELVGNNSENFWTFDGRNTGTLEDVDADTLTRFIGFQSITGGDGADTFLLVGTTAGVDGTIDGGDEPLDSFDSIDFSEIPGAYTVYIGEGSNGITGVEGFTGYRSNDSGENPDRTLVGRNFDGNIWTISNFDGNGTLADGVNDGRYQQGISSDPISFVNFNRLVGGNGDDTFTFYDNAYISGEINGGAGGGRNVVDGDSGATPTSGRDLVAQINGDIDGILNLLNIQSIVANDGNTNTLIAGSLGASHTWTIDEDNSGNINGIEFANFANLTGSDIITDHFEFQGTATVTGLIQGGSLAGDTVDLTGLSDEMDVIVQIGSVVNDYLNINGMESVSANPLNNNQLIAADRANTWNVNGTNEGNIERTGNVLPETTIAFDGFESLSGGSDSDLFILDGDDDVTGLLDGGAGEESDELRLTSLTRDIVVVLDSLIGDAQNEVSAVRFETVSANTANINTLVAGNDPNLAASANNTWEIELENEGRLNNAIDFIGFDNLVGGDTNDTFEFSLLGAITGYIDGGDESSEDVVDMRLLPTVSVMLGDGANSLRDIERVVGNNRNSTLTADNIINVWNLVSGVNDGTVNGLVFTDFNQLVGGSERDTFTIDGGAVTGSITGAGGNDIVNLTLAESATGELAFIGGDQNDTLIISGGNDDYSATYSPDVAGESRLVYSDPALNTYTVRYGTTEAIQDNVVANLLTINGSTAAENITLGNDNVAVEGFAQVNYDNKNNIVLAGAADDTVIINDVVNVPGQLSIRNSTVAANDGAMVVANAVLFNATGPVGTQNGNLVLDTDNILVRSANGDIYLENRDSVILSELSTANRFSLVAAGQVSSSAALSAQGAVSIVANNGDIELTNPSNGFEGPLSLSAANNNITLVNNSATDLAGIVSQTLNVTSAGAIGNSAPLVVNGLATFDSIADVNLDNSNNDFSSVSVLNADNVILVDRNQLTLANFDDVGTLTTQSTGLVVNGAIEAGSVDLDAQAGTATISNAISVSGVLSVLANGVAINSVLSANEMVLTDTNGGINLGGTLNGTGGEILLTSASAGIQHQGQINSTGGNIRLEAAREIIMGASAQTTSADGLISYISGGAIGVSNINAGTGTIAFEAGTDVTDLVEGSADIVANRLEIASNAGIGGINERAVFETNIAELFVTNDRGNVRINNTDTILIDRLRNNGDIYFGNDVGDIIFNNELDNSYDRNQSDARLAGGASNANYNEGLITIESGSGSILATGLADASQPDIVGRNAVLAAPFGEIGFGGRPLVLYIRDQLDLQAIRSLRPFWGFNTPPTTFINQSLQLDLLDLISLGGEQLVEVEELEEVNPAIFTPVTNYFYDDVSIRLPDDQLYEDELEELAASEL